MELIEKSMILLLKKIKIIFLRHASFITIYLFYMIIGRLLLNSYKPLNYRLGTLTLLFTLGLALHLLYNKFLRKRLYKIISAIFLVTLVIFIFYYSLTSNYFNTLISNAKTASNLIYNREHFDFSLIKQLLATAVPSLSFISLELDKKGKGEFTILLFFIPVIFAHFYGIPKSSNIYIILYIFLSILYFSINYHNKTKNKLLNKKIKNSTNRNTVISFSLYLSLVIVSVSYLSIQVFGTKNISDIVEKIQRNLIKYEDRGKKSLYTISNSGFGNNTKLGGPITLNKAIAIRVKSDKPYYLRGIVKDYYDGFQWKDSSLKYFIKGSSGIFSPDENYIKYMLGYNDEQEIVKEKATLTSKSISIYPETLQSSTLFSPYNTFNIKCGRDYIGYTYERTFMLLNKLSPENHYSASFYESINGVENVINNKDTLVRLDYEPNSTLEKEKEYYENNIKKVYGAYLGLPNNISKETYDLVNLITRDASNTQEKVWKIYNYLNSNYKYSLDVSEIPAGKEFLHYFLFTEKKGYCTYFATAAVVFCRIAGIPARYVEGFHMDETKDSNGLYIVGNDKAHAWAEILISDKHNLWSVLDPVPAQNNSSSEGYSDIPQNTKIDQWVKDEIYNDSIQDNHNSSDLVQNEFYNEQINISNRKEKIYSALRLLLYLLIFALPTYILFYIYLRISKYKRLKYNILNSDSIIPLYNYSKQRLELVGLKCSPSISELEFIESIDNSSLKKELSVVVELYHMEYYGEKKLLSFNKRKFYEFLEAYVKERQNIVHYYYCKFK